MRFATYCWLTMMADREDAYAGELYERLARMQQWLEARPNAGVEESYALTVRTAQLSPHAWVRRVAAAAMLDDDDCIKPWSERKAIEEIEKAIHGVEEHMGLTDLAGNARFGTYLHVTLSDHLDVRRFYRGQARPVDGNTLAAIYREGGRLRIVDPYLFPAVLEARLERVDQPMTINERDEDGDLFEAAVDSAIDLRQMIMEDGVLRRIMPPTPIADDDLPALDGDGPVTVRPAVLPPPPAAFMAVDYKSMELPEKMLMAYAAADVDATRRLHEARIAIEDEAHETAVEVPETIMGLVAAGSYELVDEHGNRYWPQADGTAVHAETGETVSEDTLRTPPNRNGDSFGPSVLRNAYRAWARSQAIRDAIIDRRGQ